MTTLSGDNGIRLLTITTPHNEERLVRDQQTNEVYLSLTAAVFLKRKGEMLYVPLQFENGLTIDAAVDSRAYLSATTQNVLVRIKQQAPNNIIKNDNSPTF